MGMEDFYTKDRANEGRELKLYTPDGQPTKEWLVIRHVWSDAFQDAEESSLRQVQEQTLALGKDADAGALVAIKRDATTALLASLVASWSFPEDCTPENVAAFLRKAPQIAEQINRFAADAKGFFGSEPRKPSRGSKAKSA